MTQRWKKVLWLLPVVAALVFLFLAFRPKPVPVEVLSVASSPMQVAIDEEGVTRAHDRYNLSAPVAGRLLRLSLHEGDAVSRGQVLARIDPLPIDPKARAELQARLQATQAQKNAADQHMQQAQIDHIQARRERERGEQLARDRFVSQQTLEQAKTAEFVSVKILEAARFKSQAAAAEVRMAEAVLLGAGAGKTVQVRTPVSGRVLKVLEKSERVVAAGTPLLVVGDAGKLEVVIDVLSTDAVKIKPGMPVWLEDWGGDQPLRARVRLIEPAAFTQVSALGIEEQRVNVIADLLDPPGPLGDGYRIKGRIILWSGEKVLQVPLNAVFRDTRGWAVFVVEQGRAQRRAIETGRRNTFTTEVRSGLRPGESVIVHPSNQVADGVRVTLHANAP